MFLFGFGISFININYGDREQYDGLVYEVKDNYFLLNIGGEKLYCYQKNHPYEIGDIVSISGNKKENDFSTLESAFDFSNYLENKGVNNTLNIKKIDVKFSNPIRLKVFRKYFLSFFDEDTSITVASILFSDNDDNDVTNIISSLHLSRLISAGGLYFHAISGFLIYLLSKRIKPKWARLITIGILSFYIFVAFPRFSLIRLGFVFLFRWVNEFVFKKRFNQLELLSISAMIFLLFDYHLAYQDSFILGFFIPIIIHFINASFIYLSNFKKKILTVVLLYLFFLPFEIKYFHATNPLLIIYQTILSPLFILMFIISIICLYGLPFSYLANLYHKLLKVVVNPFKNISLEIYAPPLNDLLLLIYYLLFIALLYYASINFRPIKKWLMIIYISLVSIYFLPIKNYISNEVSFINVGQGDCSFIRYKNKVVFIDTGGLKYIDLANESLIPFLKKKKIYHVDYVITTHNDYDHNGALTSLVNHFKVKNVLTNDNFYPFEIGDLKFVNYNNHIHNLKDDNDRSLVIGFTLSNTSYLITGDASIENEKMIMNEYQNIPCDVLKVGHHGSKTSTSEKFIKWLKPKVGIISCGKNNSYGHPHQEVINILKRNNVEIRRTDIEGTISFVTYFS